MIGQVTKWGKRLAVRIPKAFAKELAVEAGQSVSVTVKDGSLIVKPELDVPHYNLDTLVAGITEANRHGEVAVGTAVGNEKLRHSM